MLSKKQELINAIEIAKTAGDIYRTEKLVRELATLNERDRLVAEFAEEMTSVPIDAKIITDEDPDLFLKAAKLFVVGSYNNRVNDDDAELSIDDVYIVWFAKILQNWKALISTDRTSGMYFEVTFNGDKETAYVDHYFKVAQDVFDPYEA